jgi:hypothetical protein
MNSMFSARSVGLPVLFLLGTLAVHSVGNAQQSARTVARDSARRQPVTAEHLRTAFRDPFAGNILAGARRARLAQDSMLFSYDARAYQRASVDLSFSEVGRDRLAYRSEGATRVRWHKDIGAFVEIEGAREVTPIASGEGRRGDTTQRVDRSVASDMQLPYFPGSEALWIGSDVAETDVDERSIIHPLASGSEAYYRYERGDSAQYSLPDGTRLNLVELRITPREAKWNLIIGSFWFDAGNYRLVKAAYRLAVPLDVWSISINNSEGGAGALLARAILNPIRGTVSAITVEYALYEQQFWLPRVRTADGMAQIAFARIPFELQQRFEYLSVNGDVNIPAIPLTPAMARADSAILRDSLARLPDPESQERARQIAERLSGQADTTFTRAELRRRAARGDTAAMRALDAPTAAFRAVCDTAASTSRVSRTDNRSTRILTTSTCNDSLLINSPQLPPSIYSSTDSILGPSERERMREQLRGGMQMPFSPQLPVLQYGLGDGMLRYNRVEGLSPAIGLQQTLGAGLSLRAEVRMGTADREVNGEVGLTRSAGLQSLRVSGYRRLIAANDWGNPLNFGSSFQALVFGRDEGFYYRGSGVELAVSGQESPFLALRLYGERHRGAEVRTDFSLAGALDDRSFQPNIVAEDGDLFGAGFRLQHTLGEDPAGFRVFTQLKGENGIGDFAFARGLFDITLSRGLFGKLGAALTLSSGSSVGALPVQRHFYLGGTQSVRGQRAGTQSGDAFWMARVEVGDGSVAARRVFFADFGWAGSRLDWGRQARAQSGVGTGWSFMDGLIRMDVARGIYPGKVWRFASYLEARF